MGGEGWGWGVGEGRIGRSVFYSSGKKEHGKLSEKEDIAEFRVDLSP